jgi:hypothetical protein
MVARLMRWPEAAMMPTYALFTLWMLATAVVLLSRARGAAGVVGSPSVPA